MTEQAKIGFGVSVIRNTTLYGELAKVTFPSPEVGEIDATTHDSPNYMEQVVAGLIKVGQATFTINCLGDTASDDLIEDVWDRATDLWTFVLPPAFARAMSFSGFLKKSDLVVELKDKTQINVTITVQTKPTWVKTASAGLSTTWISFKNNADEAITNFTPAAADAVREYLVTSFSDDTGIKITPIFTAGTCYVNGTSVATGVASSAITIGTATGSITNIPIIVWESAKVPKVYWVRVTHGTVASPT